MKVELRSFHGDLCILILHVVIVATDSFSRCRMFRFSAPGWFTQRRPFSAKPRRHQTALRDQAVACSHATTALLPSLRGNWKHGVPETSPYHGQAKQIGELDPRKVTTDCRERSRGIETSTEFVVGSRNASAQFVIGSARGQPRLDPVKENLRSPTRRPIQACEVESSPQGSRAGSMSQILTPAPCVRSLCLSSANSSPRRAEVVSTGIVHGLLYKLYIVP